MSSILDDNFSKLRLMNYFATNLKTLRKEKNLTQPQLAQALNVSKGMISLWENEICEPTASNIIAVANFFNISIDDLLLTNLI
ncbi:MAG: helix-turn-helix transcriptional regulator [Clostridia bacterium]|nr:helix-turn-helix transcriptional regulator [Clostridia bacterium]